MLAEPADASSWPFNLLFLKDLSFPKDLQLRKGWEYEQVYDEGKRLHGNGFSLICRANGLAYSRIGISVNRRIRGAVKRNRIKRIVRESFRLYRDRYPQRADIVFTVRPDFSLSSPQAIISAVEPLGQKWIGR